MPRGKGSSETARAVVIDARVTADRQRTRTHARKLTPAQRKEAAARYWRGERNLRQLAEEYGVSEGRMSQITRTYMPETHAAPR